MNTVKRAIIMAAGLGERMHPLTYEIPKPLIPVNGVRMIETVIEGLLVNNIREIHIVVGYMKEKFDFLKTKYPEVSLRADIETFPKQFSSTIAALYCLKVVFISGQY